MTKTFAIAAMATLGVAMAASAVAGDIQSIETGKRKDGGYEAIVIGDSLAKPKILRAMGGKVYIAEFAGHLRTDRVNSKVGVAGINSLQVGWFSARPPKVRLVLRLAEGTINPVVESVEGGWKIYVPGTLKITTPILPVATTEASTKSEALPIKREDGSIVPPKLPYGDYAPFVAKKEVPTKVGATAGATVGSSVEPLDEPLKSESAKIVAPQTVAKTVAP